MRECVFITGAASDIGSEIALKLSGVYDLIISDWNVEDLKLLEKQCSEHCKVKCLKLDLMNTADIESLLTEWIQNENLIIHKFIHCAGIAKRVPLKVLKADYFLEAFNVNVVSAAMIIKILTSRKNQKALTSVVLTASTAAERGVGTFSVYGASKAAVEGLMRNLAIELAPNVRVNSISPGAIMTKATKTIIEPRVEEIQAKYPLGLGKPSDLAGVVQFLLSDEARWITGQNLVIDGGRTIDGRD